MSPRGVDEAGAREPDLLAALAVAIREVGRDAFLERPIVEPTARFFPAPWTPDERGVEAVLRTLLAHADLHLDVVVSTSREELGETHEEPALTFHPGESLWLSALEDRVALFGVDLDELGDAAGAASHEIAHAYRVLHVGRAGAHTPYRRGRGDPDAETRLTIAAEEARAQAVEIALGFGLLALNHSLVRQTTPFAPVFGWDTPPPVGAGFAFLGGACVMRPRPGHVSPDGVALLFASQLVARRATDAETARLAKHLLPDPRELFLAAVDRARSRREATLLALGV